LRDGRAAAPGRFSELVAKPDLRLKFEQQAWIRPAVASPPPTHHAQGKAKTAIQLQVSLSVTVNFKLPAARK
jgi:hypothetical protein